MRSFLFQRDYCLTLVSDSRFEDLISDLCANSKLDREALLRLIQEKKAKVGGGYLTEQGALFLVASDLGVTVDYDNERPPSLSRLEADSRSVTVLGRILSLGKPKMFTRKSDSTKGLLSKLIIYDSSGAAVVTVWDSAVMRLLDPAMGVKPGDVIEISEAYTRAGLDGRPELNIGEKGQFKKLQDGDDEEKKIESIEKIVVTPSAISDGGKFLAIRGKIKGEVRRNNFNRREGSASSLVSFSLSDELGAGDSTRVVIWNNLGPAFDRIRDGDLVTLLNVRTKASTFQTSTAVEIHGDETTCVNEFYDETRAWMLEGSKEFSGSRTSASIADGKVSTNPQRTLPFVGRVISKRYSSTDKKYHLLLLDSQKRKISVTASDDAAKNIGEEISHDSVVLCKPDSLDQTGLKATCTILNSISRVVAKRPDIPLASTLFVKVEELPSEEGAIASLELICLNDNVAREIQTREGLVKRSELTVADHTGEVKVYGWRNLSKMLEEFSAGDRIVLRAVETQIFEGRKFLVLKNFSSVEKKPISG